MALTKELEEWIRKGLRKGVSEDRLKKELVKAGYSDKDIGSAFKKVKVGPKVNPWVIGVFVAIVALGLVYLYTNLTKEKIIGVEDWNQWRGVKRESYIEIHLDEPLAESIELNAGREYTFTLVAKGHSSDAQEFIPVKAEPFVRTRVDPEGNVYNETITPVIIVNKSYWEEHPEEQWPHVIVRLDNSVIYDGYITSDDYVKYKFKAFADRDGIYNLTIQFLNYYEDTYNFDEKGIPLNYRSLTVKEVRYK